MNSGTKNFLAAMLIVVMSVGHSVAAYELRYQLAHDEHFIDSDFAQH